MAVTVGTDVYLSVADADTYWSNKNNSTWSAATTADKEKALREATQYIDGNFSFIGELASYTQALAWPRASAEVVQGNFKGAYYSSTTTPPQVEDACAEVALEALSARLVPVQERGGAVKREKVDVIEQEYFEWAPSQKTFGLAAMILSPVLSGASNGKKLVRV